MELHVYPSKEIASEYKPPKKTMNSEETYQKHLKIKNANLLKLFICLDVLFLCFLIKLCKPLTIDAHDIQLFTPGPIKNSVLVKNVVFIKT